MILGDSACHVDRDTQQQFHVWGVGVVVSFAMFNAPLEHPSRPLLFLSFGVRGIVWPSVFCGCFVGVVALLTRSLSSLVLLPCTLKIALALLVNPARPCVARR